VDLADKAGLILDVDGVLTDGALYVSPSGEFSQRFSVQDGMGLVLARKAGLRVAILSGRESSPLHHRAEDLGIEWILMGQLDKASGLRHLCAQMGLSPSALMAVGDDLPDLAMLMKVGFSACPANAHPEVKSRVDFVCSASGGNGVAREVVDMWLKAQGLWDSTLAQWLPKEEE